MLQLKIVPLYIGLLSGTSIDEVDAALFDFSDPTKISLVCTHSHPIPPDLKTQTLDLSQSGQTTLKQIGELDFQWGKLFAEAVQSLLQKAQLDSKQIIAIGSHGQTIWHQPQGNYPFTMQIGNPHIIAKQTGIKTVADFRRSDMAVGGQGAPLAPLFHQLSFQSTQIDRVIVNLGGIANISYLPKDSSQSLIGYDTGPANSLLDSWCQLHQNKPYDKAGEWARTGQIHVALLERLLSDRYFKQPYPKSTGKDYFNVEWLTKKLKKKSYHIAPITHPENIQASLTELTAITLSDAIKALPLIGEKSEVILCGGGAYNTYLIERIQNHLDERFILSSSKEKGIDPNWVEAALFAWLAKANIENIALDYRAITGTSKPTVLGAQYFPN